MIILIFEGQQGPPNWLIFDGHSECHYLAGKVLRIHWSTYIQHFSWFCPELYIEFETKKIESIGVPVDIWPCNLPWKLKIIKLNFWGYFVLQALQFDALWSIKSDDLHVDIKFYNLKNLYEKMSESKVKVVRYGRRYFKMLVLSRRIKICNHILIVWLISRSKGYKGQGPIKTNLFKRISEIDQFIGKKSCFFAMNKLYYR